MKDSLGRKIKLLRIQNDMSQKELGDLLGVQRTSISSYESDRIKPDIDKIKTMAKLFNVSTDYLLGLKNDEINNVVAAHFKDDADLSKEDLDKIDSYISFLIEKNKSN